PGKSGLMRFLLAWAQRNGFAAEALALLGRSWRGSGLAENELRLWEQRLAPAPAAGPAGPPPPSREELALAFERVSTVEALAGRAADADRLLELVEAPPAAEALARVVRLATRFAAEPAVA